MKNTILTDNQFLDEITRHSNNGSSFYVYLRHN